MAADPKPKTLALLAEDAEFPKNASEGIRDLAKQYGVDDRLRQDLPAGDARLYADRPRDPGDQPRHGVRRLLPAGLGRHAARGDRKRAQDPVFRRRHGRVAIHLGKAAVRAKAQRRRRLRLVDPGADDAVSGHSRFPEEISGEGASRRRRSRWAGICRPSPTPTCRCWRDAIEGDEDARPGQARRLHPQPSVQDDRRRHQPSARTANGRSRACSKCSGRTSRATISTSSRTPRPR